MAAIKHENYTKIPQIRTYEGFKAFLSVLNCCFQRVPGIA